jgi:hypothetical protein
MIKKVALLLLLLSGMLQAEMFDKGQSDVGVSIGGGKFSLSKRHLLVKLLLQVNETLNHMGQEVE